MRLTVVAIMLTLAACSGGEDAVPVTAPETTGGTPGVETVDGPDGTAPGSSPVDDVTPSTAPPSDGSPDASSQIDAPATTFTVVEVPETGVPGLDSPDTFCSAWSRFGGSWQVIQVAANFAPDPSIVPAMEVVAAPVVVRAYDAMFAAWPDELDAERDAVADGFFGPLARRAEVARGALVAAGASDADLDVIAAAWEAALAVRRPDEPVVRPELPDELWALVDGAAADFDARLVGFVADPSMLITVETPATDAYLATACPDQGALTGAEVGTTGDAAGGG